MQTCDKEQYLQASNHCHIKKKFNVDQNQIVKLMGCTSKQQWVVDGDGKKWTRISQQRGEMFVNLTNALIDIE